MIAREYRHARRLAGPAALSLLLAGCAPALGPPAWLIDGPRILAVIGDAPEVAPGAGTTFRALVVSPDGDLDLSSASWALCTAALPLTASGPISPECVEPLPGAAQGDLARLSTSSDACNLFGSLGSGDSPRPHPADATGGYYQPVQLVVAGQLGFAQERIFCPLAQAPFQASVAYAQSYPLNQNPVIVAFAVTTETGEPVSLDFIPPQAKLRLQLRWSAESRETFPVLDASSLALVQTQEALRVFWFATAGEVADSQSAADASGLAAGTGWLTPASPGPFHLWAVLRDDRGGAAWASLQGAVVAR